MIFLLCLQCIAHLSRLVYPSGYNPANCGGQNEDGKRTTGKGEEEGGIIRPEICAGQIQKIEKEGLCATQTL